eukprot:1823463-Pyramimonas_sp.AAC.1
MRPEVGIGLLAVGLARELASLASLPTRHQCPDCFCDCPRPSECPKIPGCVRPLPLERQPVCEVPPDFFNR